MNTNWVVRKSLVPGAGWFLLSPFYDSGSPVSLISPEWFETREDAVRRLDRWLDVFRFEEWLAANQAAREAAQELPELAAA